MANFATTAECNAGFGLLRMDPTQVPHEKALVAALRSGITTFDLGSITDPATTEKKVWVGRLIRELGVKGQFRFLIRGKIGESSNLSTFIQGSDSGVTWIYFIEGDHGISYQTFQDEIRRLETNATIANVTTGVSSSRFTYPKEDPEFLSLEGLHGIVAVEFPLNLYESAAFQLANQSRGDDIVSLLEAAPSYGIETFSRRPLDALTDTQLLRLVSYPDHHRLDVDQALRGTLEAALEAEKKVCDVEAKWAHRLHSQLQFVKDPEQWKEILRRKIRPDIDALRTKVMTGNISSEAFLTVAHYLECLESTLLVIQVWCEKRAAERNEHIRNQIASSSAELRGGSRNLAELALSIYRSMPGLGTVLVGMRSEEYVNSVVKTFTSERPLYSAESVQLALDAAHTSIHENQN